MYDFDDTFDNEFVTVWQNSTIEVPFDGDEITSLPSTAKNPVPN